MNPKEPPMIDRTLSAALTFCLLAAAALAIDSAVSGMDHRVAAPSAVTTAAPVRIVQLERVVIVGKRLPASTKVAQTGASTAPQIQ
jgi:hypothetical protein